VIFGLSSISLACSLSDKKWIHLFSLISLGFCFMKVSLFPVLFSQRIQKIFECRIVTSIFLIARQTISAHLQIIKLFIFFCNSRKWKFYQWKMEQYEALLDSKSKEICVSIWFDSTTSPHKTENIQLRWTRRVKGTNSIAWWIFRGQIMSERVDWTRNYYYYHFFITELKQINAENRAHSNSFFIFFQFANKNCENKNDENHNEP
jgi:hypothetical protein